MIARQQVWIDTYTAFIRARTESLGARELFQANLNEEARQVADQAVIDFDGLSQRVSMTSGGRKVIDQSEGVDGSAYSENLQGHRVSL